MRNIYIELQNFGPPWRRRGAAEAFMTQHRDSEIAVHNKSYDVRVIRGLEEKYGVKVELPNGELTEFPEQRRPNVLKLSMSSGVPIRPVMARLGKLNVCIVRSTFGAPEPTG